MLKPRLSVGTVGTVTGLVVMGLMLAASPPAGLTVAAWRVAAVGALMITWWVTESIPIPITALLPLVLFPVLGVADIAATSAPYASPVIYLFLGGFVIAMALQQCGLHRRMALGIIAIVGNQPSRLIGGFMIATAFISMWVSNTATVVMLYPMAMSVIDSAEGGDEAQRDRFAVALLLGLAYAANIGGIGSLIGSPPNALLAGFMADRLGREIGFAQWMLLGVPIVIVALPLTWLVLVRRLGAQTSESPAAERSPLREQLAALGPLSASEWVIGGVTALVAACWMFRPLIERVLPGISDTGIAIAGAVAIFAVQTVLSATKVGERYAQLSWEQVERLPWSVLLLFGGGLSLAAAVATSGLADFIGSMASRLEGVPLIAIIVIIATVVLLLTEVTSNTATAAVFIPISASIATGLGLDPMVLATPVALAASLAFMMPIATPPNAIVFASGKLTIPMMARTGVWINLIMLVLITIAMLTLVPLVFP